MDMGESEAIILSDACGTDLLLMDENKGRLAARQMGLHLLGTTGISAIGSFSSCLIRFVSDRV